MFRMFYNHQRAEILDDDVPTYSIRQKQDKITDNSFTTTHRAEILDDVPTYSNRQKQEKITYKLHNHP